MLAWPHPSDFTLTVALGRTSGPACCRDSPFRPGPGESLRGIAAPAGTGRADDLPREVLRGKGAGRGISARAGGAARRAGRAAPEGVDADR
jgi:hypothetical protein